jgi:ABC-type cobalamin transport system ATPase subunit
MIQLQDISLDKRLVHITLDLAAGQFVHVLGANGAGKSTLLRVMAGLQSPHNGDVYWQGQNLADMPLLTQASIRGYHEQQNNGQFEILVEEFLSFFTGKVDEFSPEPIENALEIKALMQRKLCHLSGGEIQRVMLARALLQIWSRITLGQAIVLLDEPLHSLDIRHQLSLLRLLSSISQWGNLVVMTSHDINLSVNSASHICLIKNGSIAAWGRPLQVMTEDNLMSVLGCRLRLVQSNEASYFLPL